MSLPEQNNGAYITPHLAGHGHWSLHKMALLFGASDDTPLHSDKLSCSPHWQLSLCNSVHGFLADTLIKLPTV